jgi:chromosome segregation ATPase
VVVLSGWRPPVFANLISRYFGSEHSAAQAVASERATKAGALEGTERALTAAQARLAEDKADFAAQHEQLLAEHAQVQALKEQIEAYRIEAHELRDRLSSEAQLDLLHQQLAGERATAHNLADAALREHINKVAAGLPPSSKERIGRDAWSAVLRPRMRARHSRVFLSEVEQ